MAAPRRGATTMGRRRSGTAPTDPASTARDRAPVALVGCDVAGRISSWNPAATRLLGWREADAVGRPVTEIFGRDVVLGAGVDRLHSRAATSFGAPLDVEVLTDPEPDPAGTFAGSLFAVIPVVRASSRVVADTSPRVHSWAEAATVIQSIGGAVQCLTVGVIGVTAVNRGYSRSTGDAVLREVLDRLTQLAGEAGRAMRIAGAQFLVITPHTAGLDADRVVAAVALPIETKLGWVRIGSCVGTAEGEARSAFVLLDQADASIRRAASRGVGAVDRADKDRPASESRHPRLSSLLIDAVARREIGVQFQPVIDLRSGAVVALEALARWTSDELGDVDPNQFIEAAEDAGLIHELGRSVLDTALDVAARYRQTGGRVGMRVSVNLSAVQLSHPDLIGRVTHALASRSLTSDALEIELTETKPVSTAGPAAANLRALHQLGIRVAVDDFGTGCANMSYLRDLPVDAIKIDRRFVAGVATRRADAAVIRAIMSAATDLRIDVIAEGVEGLDQHLALVRLGCPAAQGFLYAAPRAASDLQLDGLLPDLVRPGAMPVPAGEARRLEASRTVDLLDTPAEDDYDDLAREAASSCDAPMALVAIVDHGLQWTKAQHGIALDQLPRAESFCAHAICSDVLLEVPDARADPRFDALALVTDEPRVRFYAGAPLRSLSGDSLGTLCVMDVVPRVLSERQRLGLARLARQASTLIELRQRTDEAWQASTELEITIEERDEAKAALSQALGHDHLTGALDRRAFMTQLEAAVATARSAGSAVIDGVDGDARIDGVALLVCDVDHLRLINDTLGHSVGDHVLCVVAARIAQCTRSSEVVARIGGDEFAVLVPSGGLASVEALGMRIIEHVAHPVSINGLAEILPSLSVGVAVCTHAAHPDSLLLDAESAMARAKRLGGGRMSTVEALTDDPAFESGPSSVELISWPGPVTPS